MQGQETLRSCGARLYHASCRGRINLSNLKESGGSFSVCDAVSNSRLGQGGTCLSGLARDTSTGPSLGSSAASSARNALPHVM